ncbi:MAG: gamma-glutamyl-gamma-aminobutyrate hydrolase family protein, partial [Phycisphaerales bacterium JB041]
MAPTARPFAGTNKRPLVGITADLTEHANGLRVFTYQNYAAAIAAAGGTPVLLPPIAESAPDLVGWLDAFVLTGGDDPRTEPFGEPTDPRVTPVHPERQRFETALLEALDARAPDTPVLGVCLGMQMQALVAGGRLDQ